MHIDRYKYIADGNVNMREFQFIAIPHINIENDCKTIIDFSSQLLRKRKRITRAIKVKMNKSETFRCILIYSTRKYIVACSLYVFGLVSRRSRIKNQETYCICCNVIYSISMDWLFFSTTASNIYTSYIQTHTHTLTEPGTSFL